MAIFAPSLASSSTMALPMPLLPPVTIATLFFKSITTLLVIRQGQLCGLALIFVPVDPCFIAAVQDLNGRRFAEVAPRPIDKGSDLCPDPIHQECVHTDPCSEGDRTVEFVPLLSDRCHSGVTPDHRHDALVVVMKRGTRLSGDFSKNVLRGPDATLLGYRPELRQRVVVRAMNIGEVTQDVDSRKPFDGEVRSHLDPSAATSRQARIGGQRRCHEPATPNHSACSNRGAIRKQYLIGRHFFHPSTQL